MSSVQIELLKKVDVSQPAGKTYKQMIVTHTDLSTGKVDGRKQVDFAAGPGVWDTLSSANVGDKFTVRREKDKEGKFWQWVGITPLSAEEALSVPASVATTAPRAAATFTGSKPERVGSWDAKNELDRERFEFDKQKQGLIIRQSSLSTAVAYFAAQNIKPVFTAKDIIFVAKELEAYVLGTDQPDTPE